MVRDRAFIFHMSITGEMTFQLVPSSRSRSNIKVTVCRKKKKKKKNGRCGGISVSQTACFATAVVLNSDKSLLSRLAQ